jgi:hypothetical protein
MKSDSNYTARILPEISLQGIVMKVVKKCCTITVDISNYLLVLSFDSKVIIQRSSEIVCVKKLACLTT